MQSIASKKHKMHKYTVIVPKLDKYTKTGIIV